jgi:peptidoglycan/xylan/chitin deacetylase (PgdA/CDA1 family)
MPPARAALYVATPAMLALAAHAIVVRPPPLAWAAVALAAYVGLLLAGVFVLRLRVFVDAVTGGPRGARGIALTFDDGPHPVWTPRVLRVLADHGAVATFFVAGHKVDTHPNVVRAILEAGHTVGLHSYAHDRLLSLRSERRVREDLERGAQAIARVAGDRPLLFRPPIGHTNPTIARVVDDMNLIVVGWSVAARDGLASARPASVAARVRRGLRDGAIVLLHDSPETGDREPAALRALPEILEAAHAARLDVVPLSQFVEAAIPQPRMSASP